jgi:hypothetical protein
MAENGQFCLEFPILATAVMLLAAPLIQAQPGRRRAAHIMMYDAKTETTIKGTVDDVLQGSRGMMMGTHLSVQTSDGNKQVLLGPSNFIASSGFTFNKGEEVDITGSQVMMHGTEFLIARQVVKGGKTLVLRDKTGKPQWSGGPRAAPTQ